MKSLPLALALLLALAAPTLAEPGGSKPPDCTASNGPLPETWSGQAFAIDGDTLAGVGLKPHIRIWGIQAPELRDKQTGQETVPGMRARAGLASALRANDNTVQCRVLKFDRYCRFVAQCASRATPALVPGDAGDLGLLMIAAGLAHGFYLEDTLPWDTKAGTLYAYTEDAAYKHRTGMWPMWLGEK